MNEHDPFDLNDSGDDDEDNNNMNKDIIFHRIKLPQKKNKNNKMKKYKKKFPSSPIMPPIVEDKQTLIPDARTHNQSSSNINNINNNHDDILSIAISEMSIQTRFAQNNLGINNNTFIPISGSPRNSNRKKQCKQNQILYNKNSSNIINNTSENNNDYKYNYNKFIKHKKTRSKSLSISLANINNNNNNKYSSYPSTSGSKKLLVSPHSVPSTSQNKIYNNNNNNSNKNNNIY